MRIIKVLCRWGSQLQDVSTVAESKHTFRLFIEGKRNWESQRNRCYSACYKETKHYHRRALQRETWMPLGKASFFSPKAVGKFWNFLLGPTWRFRFRLH